MSYEFYSRYARILNSKQSRSVVLSGNIHDLFSPGDGKYVPLLEFLLVRSKTDKNIQVVYELNGPIRISDNEAVKAAFIEFKSGKKPQDLLIKAAADSARNNIRQVGVSRKEKMQEEKSPYESLSDEFESLKGEAYGNCAVGLQFLRQLCDASRQCLNGRNLQIIVETADMILPSGKDIASLNEKDRRCIAIAQDWISDPAFCNGGDSVTFIAESRSLIHDRIAHLPHLLSVEIPAPTNEERLNFIQTTANGREIRQSEQTNWSLPELSRLTAALSIQAIRQLLTGYFYSSELLSPKILVEKIEEYIKSQVGDDVVEFKKPEHSLQDCMGFPKLKQFLSAHLIPRFRSSGKDALPGAAVGGPIGAGKTFIFEAVASELGVPVIVLKNLRSQWYGQTDVIFERLRRVLEALEKVIIFVDEADTQFGGVQGEVHETEKRLTGKIQAMMSDPKLRGRVTWLLMTARIHLLSPDIRRPGRVGDLIIPVLDPEDEDQAEFLKWTLGSAVPADKLDSVIAELKPLTAGYSAASYASLRSELQARKSEIEAGQPDQVIKAIIEDQIPPNIGPTREYQRLQALNNCTRKSLIPDSELKKFGGDVKKAKEQWEKALRVLEAQGVQ